MFKAFGDSISVGVGASPVANSWVKLLAASLNQAITNAAVSGNMVPDQAAPVYATNAADGDRYTVMLGTNDERIYGANATKLEYFRAGLSALLAWLATPNKIRGNGSAVKYSGAWAITPVYGSLGRNSSTLGSKATFKVSGTVVYLGMIRQEGVSGRFTVTIDGQLMGTYSSGAAGLRTAAGLSYGPMLLRFPELSAGEHSVEIEVVSYTSSTGKVYLDWAAGNEQNDSPKIVTVNVPFAQAYPSGGSDSNVIAYNEVIASIVADLAGDGLDISLADVNSVLLADADMDGGYHPVNSGHSKIAGAISAFFSANVSFEPVAVYRATNGNFYLGASLDSPQIQLVV